MLQTNFLALNSNIGQKVQIGGFVNSIRDHGGLIFIDLRSQSDLIQCVINPEKNQEIFNLAQTVGNEFVLKLDGQIVQRESKLINPKIPTGSIELIVEKLEIVAKANPLPFEIDGQNIANEDLRLKYRYLDLRRVKLKEMLTTKSKLFLAVRNWFDSQDFVEVQTPILANSSPEGARDFLVPSRLHPGKFYALPQAPQQFKQLLMVGGFNKYFQIAPCFRDEDPRSDRHPGDFYQIDAEMAWANQDEIYDFSWKFINGVLTKFTDKKLDSEFTKIRYDEAMDWFGSDKPDLRIRQGGEKVEMENGELETQDIANANIKQDWDPQTLRIETERLILKPISLDYAEEMFNNYTSKITEFLPNNPSQEIQTTYDFITESQELNKTKQNLHLSIFDKISQEFVGNLDLRQLNSPNPDIGFWLKENKQRQGLGKEAALAIKNWADEHLNYQFIKYRVDQRNIGSCKIAESLGGKLLNPNPEVIVSAAGKKREVLEYHIPNSDSQTSAKIQDKNWIINNLGWLDTKHIFRNSGFKAFADLCEPIIKQDWNAETLQIETERLILKPISLEYADDIFREFTPEVAQTLLSQPLKNLEEQKEFIIERIKRMENRKQIMFVILDKNGEFFGICNFKNIDKKLITAGIWLKINSHGQGFGLEAMTGMTNWAKTHLNFESIEYAAYEENVASRKIAQKLGGQFIQSKKLTRLDGKIVNCVEYKIKNPNYQPSNSRVQALVIKNAVDKFSRSDLDKIQELGRSFGLPGIAYIQFEKNIENQELTAKSPILKFFGDEEMQKIKQQEIVEFLNIESGDLVLFVAHSDKDLVHKAQNAIRKHVATKLDLLDSNSLKFVWVYDFPFFEKDGKTDKIDFAHNPFGIFQNFENLTHLETLKLAKEQNRLLELRAVQYDIACNGYEVLSGGRRNNIPECLMEGFKLVGYSEEEVKEKFGHMMEAYSYGAPTHAGFAWGIDRLFMVLVDEDNIRETIAFPKNGSGMDLMMNSPSSVRPIQLKELSIRSV